MAVELIRGRSRGNTLSSSTLEHSRRSLPPLTLGRALVVAAAFLLLLGSATAAQAQPTTTPSEPTPSDSDADWHPTENPNATIVPGEMRSDREEIPGGFTKEEADRAETMEASIAQRSQLGRIVPFLAPGCQVYWPAPYEVCGAIRDKYNALGGPNSFLLWPTTNELTNPDGYGKRTAFQNGPIYWSLQGGAHPVVNHFFAAWQRNGWESGVLGYPTSDEIMNPDGGRRQNFQGGTVYWKLNEAYFVTGAIRDKWGATGWETGWLGYPQSDEIVLPDGIGRMNLFTGGSIYWSPTTDAHPVSGAILYRWGDTGFERGYLGYPIADQVGDPMSTITQNFQGGTIGVETFPLREQVASINPFRTCQFFPRADYVHISTTKRGGVVIPPTASGHGWWEAVEGKCPAGTTATVQVQLQIQDLNGNWSNRGDLGQTSGNYSGGGSSNWAEANYLCQVLQDAWWRQLVDVDIEGLFDPPDKAAGSPRVNKCQ